jgi:hypothetical protein
MPRAKKIKTEKTEPRIEFVPVQKITEPKKMIGAKLIFGLMLFVVFAGVLCFGGYFYWQYKKVLKDQPASARSETQILLEKIGQFIDLPTDEEPTIAEVKDLEKLKGKAFFSEAQNGDKVLIYSRNKKAVLYRPAIDKVIEVTSLGAKAENEIPIGIDRESAPIAIAEEKVSEEKPAKNPTSVVPEKIEPVKVVVYNGTVKKSLAAELGADILSGMPEAEIVKVGNAVGNYPETIVIDLSGNNSEVVQKIISTIGGKAGALPEGEKKPEGDILVIGGDK